VTVDEVTPTALDNPSVRLSLSNGLGAAIARERLRSAAVEARALRRSDELKTTLLSLVGHELRTPLAVMKTAATTLRDDERVGQFSDVAALAEVVGREVDRLDHMVRNLLDLSRIEGGALRLTLGWYDLGELAREAVHRLRFVLGDQPVEVRVDDDLAPVSVDYVLVDRVVANLVLNSVRQSPAGHAIIIDVRRAPTGAQLAVSDEGPGVPDEDLERIFERFYRREGPWAGAGLGLALCKAIVDAHGGTIRAARGLGGRGLTVTVELPVTRGIRAESAEPPAEVLAR
jgi:two-component system sensor histidine kinase KdpD